MEHVQKRLEFWENEMEIKVQNGTLTEVKFLYLNEQIELCKKLLTMKNLTKEKIERML